MPLQMNYTDPSGLSAAESYWIVANVNVAPPDKVGRIVFYGYVSKEAYESGKASIASKAYDLTPQVYDAFLNASGLNIEQLIAPCYAFAMQAPEPPLPGEQTPQPSFFAGASMR